MASKTNVRAPVVREKVRCSRDVADLFARVHYIYVSIMIVQMEVNVTARSPTLLALIWRLTNQLPRPHIEQILEEPEIKKRIPKRLGIASPTPHMDIDMSTPFSVTEPASGDNIPPRRISFSEDPPAPRNLMQVCSLHILLLILTGFHGYGRISLQLYYTKPFNKTVRKDNKRSFY